MQGILTWQKLASRGLIALTTGKATGHGGTVACRILLDVRFSQVEQRRDGV